MRLDRDNFRDIFNEHDIPSWTCPHCSKGTLKISKDGFKVAETAESIKSRDDEAFEPFWVRGIFMAKFNCTYDKCKEIVVATGDAALDYNGPEPAPDEFGGYVDTYAWFITPKHFSKPIKLFEYHQNYPAEIIPYVERAFGLLWVDAASCANMIRSVVELILDNKGVQKYEDILNKKTGKKERKPIFLARRIKDFTDQDLARKTPKFADACEFFHAIRWIGNVGSHGDDRLKREDLIVALEFLESALENIYNPHHIALKKRAKKVIKRKGVPVKRK